MAYQSQVGYRVLSTFVGPRGYFARFGLHRYERRVGRLASKTPGGPQRKENDRRARDDAGTPSMLVVECPGMVGRKAIPGRELTFADFKTDGHAWITLASGEYYPDILVSACELYKPVLVIFGQLLASAHSSDGLFRAICDVREQWMRIQLARVFRKYVSPETPVEMLKKKSAVDAICRDFGRGFRNVVEVQKKFTSRPIGDEALCAILWEYKDRGKKGYDLTERLFAILREQFPKLGILGPERAGRDVLLGEVFPQYPKPERPVDFVLKDGEAVLAIGLARYDSDRGGAQEDDRTGQYRDCAAEILGYTGKRGLSTKVIFLNDGPGLLLGSMWQDYAGIEAQWPGLVRVVTLRMIQGRITMEWLRKKV